MLNLYPCFKPGFRPLEGYYRNCNAYFSAGCGFSLVASVPSDYRVTTFLNDHRAMVTRDSKNYFVYDGALDKLEEGRVSKQEASSYGENGFGYYIDSSSGGGNVLVEVSSGRRFILDKAMDCVAFASGDIAVLWGEESFAGISTQDGSQTWLLEVGEQAYLYPKRIGKYLVLVTPDSDNWKTTLTFVELDTGMVLREVCLNYCGHISSSVGDRVTLLGQRKEGEQWHTAFVHYYFDSGNIEEVLVRDSREKSYLGMFGGDIAIFCLKENQFDVWKAGGEGQSFIGAVDAHTGNKISKINLPNICFHSSPGFSVTDDEYFAVGMARTPWPATYSQMILWDKEDFFNPNPEIHEEPLMGSWERIAEGDQAHYRVFVEQSCESFFQLHRQISVALHQCGAIHGFHRESEGKSRDEYFNGRIICDVSNHTLNDKEKLAIKHLCPFVENELVEGGFRSSYDPADKIKIEPLF